VTLLSVLSKDAVLSCEFRTEKETNPRVEWKKRGKEVSYVYFDGDFTGLLLFSPFTQFLNSPSSLLFVYSFTLDIL